jgi:hypothetical protein
MAFDTPNGTRGARQPGRNRLERWGNRKMVDRIRRTGTRRGDKLVLVTIGKRTGAERMTPVRWFPGEDDTNPAGNCPTRSVRSRHDCPRE